MQYDVFMTKRYVGSEDCLYLNIFVPQVVGLKLNLKYFIVNFKIVL